MTIPHVPVLAGEAIELLDPRPGQTVVDCTFGAGGHARLLGGRIGAAGTLIAIDRDPVAAERFAEMAPELAPATRFIRASFVDGLAQLRDEDVRVDIVLMDLGMSSMQIDTWQRGFSYSYDAPLDMRMDPGIEQSAFTSSSTSPSSATSRRSSATSARSATPVRSPARSSASARRRRSRRRSRSSTSSPARSLRPPASPPAIRPSASSRRCASRSTTSSASSMPRCRSPGALLRTGGRLAAISFHSLEDRRVKRFLAARAQGCICPPDLPICACGREPEAELVSRRAIAPTAGEVAANPRARSARLRVASKLREDQG